jgi:hypothetical protein
MYEEDALLSLNNYDDEDFQEEMQMYNEQFVIDESDDDTSTLDSIKKKNRTLWEDIKKDIKGFHKIKRVFNNKKHEIDLYSTSNTPGSMICDAITGNRYKEYRVGTYKEHLFFKVRLSTGELGKKCVDSLFFDSPEQYERHMKTTLSQSIKEKWLNKSMEIRQELYLSKENTNEFIVIK